MPAKNKNSVYAKLKIGLSAVLSLALLACVASESTRLRLNAPEASTAQPPDLPLEVSPETERGGGPPDVKSRCIVGAVPGGINADPFYTQYCDAQGLPILASAEVSEVAMQAAWTIITQMLSQRPDILQSLSENNTRFGVIGRNQVTTDLPEYRDLNSLFPETDWDTRTRGLGATRFKPLSSAAEENLLCEAEDRYRGESIAVHEFAHTIQNLALEQLDASFRTQIQNLYTAAKNQGLWANTYAISNAEEYWAEAVQSYFDANLEADPGDGIHNFVNTRAELQAYDPNLYALIDEVFQGVSWRYFCP